MRLKYVISHLETLDLSIIVVIHRLLACMRYSKNCLSFCHCVWSVIYLTLLLTLSEACFALHYNYVTNLGIECSMKKCGWLAWNVSTHNPTVTCSVMFQVLKHGGMCEMALTWCVGGGICNMNSTVTNMDQFESCVQSTLSMILLSFVALGCLASVSYCNSYAFYHQLVAGWHYMFLLIQWLYLAFVSS